MRRASRLLLTICLLIPLGAFAQAPIIENEFKHDTSPPLRQIPSAPRGILPQRVLPIELVPTRAGRTRALTLDAAEQIVPGPAPAFTMLFPPAEGLGKGLSNFDMTSVPPDTTGAIGTTQFVQAVNTPLLILDKNTRQPGLGPILTKQVWKGFGTACETENDGDPIVVFDRIAKRWVITQFQVTQGNAQCVAVSATDDATGAYHRYEFRYPAMNDYPKMGVWPDAYYITFNMFHGASGSRACAYERGKMLAGATARQVCFQLSNVYWSLMPADLDGPRMPATGAPNPMVSLGDDSRSLDMWRFHIDWSNPAQSTLGTGSTHRPDFNIPVAAFNDACQGPPAFRRVAPRRSSTPSAIG